MFLPEEGGGSDSHLEAAPSPSGVQAGFHPVRDAGTSVIGEVKVAEDDAASISRAQDAGVAAFRADRSSAVVSRAATPSADLWQPHLPARRRLRIYPSGNRTGKWVTREIAALEFLTGVRMRNEAAILEQGGYRDGHDSAFSAEGRWHEHDSAEGGGGGVDFAHQHAGNGAGNTTGGEDSDSDGGWLDQPLPSASTGQRLDSSRSARLGVGTPPGVSAGSGRRVPGVDNTQAPARRLRGREAAHVRIPPALRHGMRSLSGHSAAVVRQWERGLTQQERLLEGRMFFSCSKGYPITVSSVIHYKPQEEHARRVRQKQIDERGVEAFQVPKRDWRGQSYAYLLRPSHIGGAPTLAGAGGESLANSGAGAGGSGSGGGAGGSGHDYADSEGSTLGAVGNSGAGDGGGRSGTDGAAEAPRNYRAGFLDDPTLKLGRHRHVARGDKNTGPVVSSVLLFVKPRVLKDELNARFREEHPSLPPSLTLSKIRSVKRQALLGCHRADMEIATVALACIYFERLCLSGVVTKPNRRLAMAACLAIAYKFNEPVLKEGSSKLPAFWAFVDQEWQVSRKRVLEAELSVLVHLAFSLHEDPRDIFHHFVRLLKMMDSNATLYLGEDMMALHNQSLESFRDWNADEDTRGAAGNGDTGADSPRSRIVSDAGTASTDVRGRLTNTSQRPLSGSRWLGAWRAGQDGNGATASVLGRPATMATDGQSASIAGGLARLTLVGRGLGRETRQRTQKLGKNVRSSASFLGRASSRRRRGRRRMEAD